MRTPMKTRLISSNTTTKDPYTCTGEVDSSALKWCRFSAFEKTCIDLLRAGYHGAFTELVNLAKAQKDALHEVDSSTPVFTIPLTECKQLITAMLPHLIQAEISNMEGVYDEVYKRNWALSNIFRARSGYQPFVAHFLSRCNIIAKHNCELCAHSETRAAMSTREDLQHVQIADALQLRKRNSMHRLVESTYLLMEHRAESGENDEAIHLAHIIRDDLQFNEAMPVPPTDPDINYETWYSTAPPLARTLCQTMAQCYLRRASELYPSAVNKTVDAMLKALKYAREAENYSLVGTCLFRIGRLHAEQDSINLAYEYAQEYYQLSKKLNIDHQIEACRLMVDIHEKLEDSQKVESYLNELRRIAVRCGDPLKLAEVDTLVTRFYVIQIRDYDRSQEMAEDGFQLALHTNSHELTHNLRLWCGYINGCKMKSTFLPVVLSAQLDKGLLTSLIKWRNARMSLSRLTPIQEQITRYTFNDRKKKIVE